jgi:hypothetical protein
MGAQPRQVRAGLEVLRKRPIDVILSVGREMIGSYTLSQLSGAVWYGLLAVSL